nr:polymorphic toxin-type HINT domain-containing protein [Paenibacillus sp. MMS18-CY102]
MNSYDYDIWGKIISQTEQMSNPFQYTGEIYDDESGLIYLRARYYDPSDRRFISEDTYEGDITNPLTLNLYVYVGNNPLIYVDPSGNVWKWVGNSWKIVKQGASYAAKGVVAVANFMIVDDIRTILDPNSSYFDKGLALAGFLPVGKVVKGGKLVVKLMNKEGKVIERAVENTAENTKLVNKAVGAYNCFTAGTKVQTDEGEKNIEDIEVGDMVLAKDENNPDGELAYKEVTALHRNQRDDIIKLHVGEQIIETTDNHPFWVEGKGWVFADELEAGDKLQKADGSNLTIDKVEFVKLDIPVTVYNFTVADYHTYYVTDIGIWVHNTKGACGPNGTFENAPYHGTTNNGMKNKAPNDGQTALDNSLSIGPNTDRRIGISDGEFVVLDKTSDGIYHGHVRSWSELTPTMQSILRKEGLVDKKGNIK